MADRRTRVEANVDGNFFVDASCIDCDACRQLAPGNFAEAGEQSAVVRQPTSRDEELRSYRALLACPTGSIGTERNDAELLREARASFPLPIEDEVLYCGYNAEASFGANSFFIRHSDGNWLVDSPRYVPDLVTAIERAGGIRWIFLTHEDDVADAAKYAARFGATRIIHRADLDAMPEAEQIVDGIEPIAIMSDFTIIPVPGHTAGSCALLYRGTGTRFLFTGDHLWWEPDRQRLNAPRQLVWDRTQLDASIARLREYSFDWVVAGHGDRVRLPRETMRQAFDELVARRRAATPEPVEFP
ncbi:MAG: MBL fold metallo-hydrolase [Nitrospiraceae bacterium]